MSVKKTATKPEKKSFDKVPQWWVIILLAIIFILGLAARLYDLDDVPLDFHPTRQLHSMLIARGMYYENLKDAPEWKRSLAVNQWKAEGQIEPPIMERLSTWGYRLLGREDLRVPRSLSIFFWTVGGVGLYLLLTDVLDPKSAIVGVAYYMLLPYTIIASRSFQPESLMVAAIIWSYWAIGKWARRSNWKTAILAGILSGFAIFIKLPAIFFIGPAILGAAFGERKLKAVLTNPQIWVLGFLSILPALIYHVFGLFISGFLQGQTSLRFFPNLWLDPYTYLRWKNQIDKVFILEIFLISLLGSFLIQNKRFRMMFFGVFVGYLMYGLFFSYHIMSHDYYQIPLTPVIAVGLASAVSVMLESIKDKKHITFSLIILSGLLIFWMGSKFYSATKELKSADYRNQPVMYESLGEKLRDYSVISMTPDYGYRMVYWGWKLTRNWLSQGDFILRELAGQEIDQTQLFENEIENHDLFLVTNFSEFNRQSLVKKILTENYPVFDQDENYIIFDLRDSN